MLHRDMTQGLTRRLQRCRSVAARECIRMQGHDADCINLADMDVLQLDVSGRPQAWIAPRDAAVLYASDAVAWTLGDTFQVLRGGIQRVSGGDFFMAHREKWALGAFSPFMKRRVYSAPPVTPWAPGSMPWTRAPRSRMRESR